jgi:hypothetical protein
MNTYIVYSRSTGLDVYAYQADKVSNTEVYPLDQFDHVAQQPPVAAPPAAELATAWLIDVGSFFDRFGDSKIPILASADPFVMAIRQDILPREWVDLKRPDVAAAIDVFIGEGLCTADLKAAILTTPVTHMEQLALMVKYGAALNGN